MDLSRTSSRFQRSGFLLLKKVQPDMTQRVVSDRVGRSIEDQSVFTFFGDLFLFLGFPYTRICMGARYGLDTIFFLRRS